LPPFSDNAREQFDALVSKGVVVHEPRSFPFLLSLLQASGEGPKLDIWDEPEAISLANGQKLLTTPQLRLTTQASAQIIDDSWNAFLPPLSDEISKAYFSSFHAGLGGFRVIYDGARRGFSVECDFEIDLAAKVRRAIAQHSTPQGAIILHGQSGVGKTVALAHLVVGIRSQQLAAVLFVSGRLPLATDVGPFLEAIDKQNSVTAIVVDAMAAPPRYDQLLESLRSRGHRVVVVGSTYRIEPALQYHGHRYVEAPARLSKVEYEKLLGLIKKFAPEATASIAKHATEPYALARFYRDLPSSRPRLSEGLGREARSLESDLRRRGRERVPTVEDALGDFPTRYCGLFLRSFSEGGPTLFKKIGTLAADG
jgi:hypothetical protein